VRTGALLFVTGTVAIVVLVILASVLVLAKSNLIGVAQAMLALLYVGHIVLAGESTWEALALVSLGILLVGELSQWSFDSRVAGRYESGMHLSRAIGVAVQLALGVAVIMLAAFALGLPSLGDPWAVLAATAASLALIALVARVALSAPGRPSSPS
jgi:hypothetical protein